MPRTLPWLLEQDHAQQVQRESTPRKRVKREPHDTDLTPKNPPSSPDKKDFFRSSQTPPTSPARACPPEEFLIEGLDQDDAWIMVEDEFYAVAQSFTRHLHYAEYLRRKNEVKAQGADAIRELERPTDGRTVIPKDLQRRKNAEALATRQKAGLEQKLEQEDKEGGEDDEDTDTWAGTHLQGFIASPRKGRSLLGARGLKSCTRAAAGFGQAAIAGDSGGFTGASQSTPPPRVAHAQEASANEETASEDGDGTMEAPVPGVDQETASEDDDLDGLDHPTVVPSTKHWKTLTPTIKSRPNYRNTERCPSTSKGKAKPAQSQHANGFKSRVQSLFDDLDELPEPPQSTPIFDTNEPSLAEQTPKASSQKNSLERKNSRLKDVPSFWV